MQTRLTRIFLIVIILSFLNPPLLKAATEQRIALIIGNSQYDVGRLKNPVNDATDMASSLQRLGFTVILKKNSSQQEMEESIRDFGHRLKRGGVGLFFYAGHAVQLNGKNYLIPIGARIEKETDAKYKAIDAEMVLDEMANAGNQMNIIILDACRDNPLGRSLRSAGRGLTIISDAPQGTFITYSTSPGKTAPDGEGRNSPYTAALLKSINEPGLPIEQVFKKVRQRLSRETGNRQIPWELSSLQGDFYFTPGLTSAARNAETREDASATRPTKAKEVDPSISTETLPTRFVHPGGSFRKHGQTWIEEPPYAPGKHFQFREFIIDKDYIYLVDESRRNKDNSPMLLRFPIHGGFLQWSFQNPITWTNLYLVKPEHDH